MYINCSLSYVNVPVQYVHIYMLLIKSQYDCYPLTRAQLSNRDSMTGLTMTS